MPKTAEQTTITFSSDGFVKASFPENTAEYSSEHVMLAAAVMNAMKDTKLRGLIEQTFFEKVENKL